MATFDVLISVGTAKGQGMVRVVVGSRELLRVLKKGSNPQQEKSDLHEEKKNPQEEKRNPQEEKNKLLNTVGLAGSQRRDN